MGLAALIIGSISLSKPRKVYPSKLTTLSQPIIDNTTFANILNLEIPLLNQVIIQTALPAINSYLSKNTRIITLPTLTLTGSLILDTLVIGKFSQTSALATTSDCMSLQIGGNCAITFTGHYNAVVTCPPSSNSKICQGLAAFPNFDIGILLNFSGGGSISPTVIGNIVSNYSAFKTAIDNSKTPNCLIKPIIAAWGETLGTFKSPGTVCSKDSDCAGNSCGIMKNVAKGGNPVKFLESDYKCCPSGATVPTEIAVADFLDFCTEQPIQSACNGAKSDNKICASGWCDLDTYTCFEPEQPLQPCVNDYECAPGASGHPKCGKWNTSSDNEGDHYCCPSGDTHQFGEHEWCTMQPNGNKCRGDGSGSSPMCASKCCNSSDVCAASGCSSCFIAETLITMANGLKKPISTIKKGEEVLSAKSFKPVKVLVVDDMNKLGYRNLIGFNGIKPFVTEDHCFINPTNNNNRLTFNLEKSMGAKHWKNATEIQEGIELINENSIRKVKDITKIVRDKDLRVYDLITEDHSYIANGYGVYDDFPEIEKYQFKSLVILEICKLVQDRQFDSRDKIYKLLPEFYWNNVNRAINTVKEFDITPEFFKARFDEFIKLVDKKKQILYLGAALWKQYLPKINNQNFKIKPLPKIIQV